MKKRNSRSQGYCDSFKFLRVFLLTLTLIMGYICLSMVLLVAEKDSDSVVNIRGSMISPAAVVSSTSPATVVSSTTSAPPVGQVISQISPETVKKPSLPEGCVEALPHPSALPQKHIVQPPSGPISLVCCSTTMQAPLNIAVHHAWGPRGAARFMDMVRHGFFSEPGVPLFRALKVISGFLRCSSNPAVTSILFFLAFVFLFFFVALGEAEGREGRLGCLVR